MTTEMLPLSSITTLAGYLQAYGAPLAKKAIQNLVPLHTPGKDPIPSFTDYLRQPYEAQAHLAVAAGKMFDTYGGGFIIGECGTGKTVTSILAVNEHAKHGEHVVPRYRSIVVCPDHLVKKWKREIEKTVRNTEVHIFAKWWDFLDLVGAPTPSSAPKRRGRPPGPTWFVMGRDQIKRTPGTRGIAATKRFLVDEEQGKPGVEARVVCPKCGAVPTDKGSPISQVKLGKQAYCCKSLVLTQLPGDRGSGLDRLVQGCRDSASRFPDEHRKAKPGAIISHAGKRWEVSECGEPLWQYTDSPYRWPPAKLVQKRMRRLAEYLVIDEAHEAQSEESHQSMALGKILASTRYALALTGTFINGKAESLFPLFMRMAEKELRARGFEWGDREDFSKRYGCVDRIVRSKTPVASVQIHGRRGFGKTQVGSSQTSTKATPGIMPTLFSEIVMPRTMFLKLDQFVDYLPAYAEIPLGFDLPDEVESAYRGLEGELKTANRSLMAKGNMKLMGTMLHTLLGYPDSPWDWPSMFPGEKDQFGFPVHAVGWWHEKGLLTNANFVGVVTPQEFDPANMILPKEQALIDLCKEHTKQGDQTWVYCYMTQKKDVQPRLKELLEAEGLRVGILRGGDAKVQDREDWIEANGYKYDVVMSHPKMVATGMDLFSADSGRHNFNRLIFYQCGYELSILRQASRRSWRLGQPKDCTVHLLYYRNTSQELAVNLMGLKLGAATMLEEGNISDEGLAAMGGGGDERAALVSALGSVVDPADIQRNWGRVQSRPRGGKMSGRVGDQGDELFEAPDNTIEPDGNAFYASKPEFKEPEVEYPEPEYLAVLAKIEGLTNPPAQDEDDDDLAEAASRMRAWVKNQEVPGPKLYVPEETDDPVQRKFQALAQQARDGEEWDW
jgi:hypothetical protein